MEVFSQIRPVSLREQVVERVRTAIIEGRLKPNDHITEVTLTKQLGVSRTPVREALILLEREGLVISSPNRGCFVRVFTEQDINHIFSMRTTLENFASEIVIDRISDVDIDHLRQLIEIQRIGIAEADFKRVRSVDMSFHHYLIDLSNHPILQKNWTELVAQIAAVLYLRAEAIPDYDEMLAIQDHNLIVNALEQHDLEEVKAQNRRINTRVAGECCYAVNKLQLNQRL